MYEAKKQLNLHFLYILAYNSANKPSFQNPINITIAEWHINRVIDQNI